VQNWTASFSRHSCNRIGLMCNPSRHFKGREARTDVVLLVDQMGLYDEKSIIPIQASLPSLVNYKAIHSISLQEIISFFSSSPKQSMFFYVSLLLLLYFYLHLPLLASVFSPPLLISPISLLLPIPSPPSPSLLLKTCKCGIS